MDLQLKPDPESEQYLSSQAGEPSSSTVGENGDSQKKNPVRKRTKTGCLTCRRRRIKCDEAKPRCTNCTKSRRACEGYNQRITFKEPVSSYHPHPAFFGHSQPAFIPHAPDPLTAAQLAASQHARAGIPPGSLTVIAPKPPEFYHFQEVYPPQPTPSNAPPSAPLSQTQFSPHSGPPSSSFNHPHLDTPVSAHAEYPADGFFNVVSPSMTEESDGMFTQYSVFDNRVPQPISRTPTYQPPDTRDRNEEQPVHYSESQEDPYWSPDDEASMGESEDEDGYEAMAEADQVHLESNDLGIQVARRMDRQAEYYDARIRTFTGFVDANNVLDTYTPSSTNSPLNDTQTASVFWYFVNVTGPSMSLYERHPFDPSPMFQGQPVPKARRHIWTYTFPIIAFNHPALLQAMLALGSLQMAKLQGIPATASMKHYHLSLRRLAKNYQSPTRRTQPATLAATLLLGFYEVWNSDHAKWCKHMWGARAIIREIPLKDMTKAVLGLKRKRRQRLHDLLRRQQQQPPGNFGAVDPFSFTMNEDMSNVQPDFTDVNTGLISQITGTTVTYEDFGHIYNEDGQRKSARKYTDRDVETYEHLSDLYWWYCKMDVYQSILGATSLFMEYDLWTQCAPRGPFNHTGAIFGTYDHLMLLLGRLCNFVAQDINRKRKAARRGHTAASAGAAGQRPAGIVMAPGQSPPMWAGLVPTSGFVTVPTGFSPPRDATPQSDGSEDIDFEESTTAALREWDSIRKAFEIFRTNLGPDFDQLGPDLGPPQPTPFGPAATYRTFSIAGIWMNYYMGLIALHRAHPSRPPFAMVAAGMAAQETGMWANEIGRIAAGLTMEDCSNLAGISTLVGAAFIESCFCLFVAAVQYRDEAQRHWTVRRLHDIGRLTGWQSAIQIAEGCESAWLKAAQLGKGPPYQRPLDVGSQLSRSVWQNTRRLDRRIRELSSEQPASNVLTKSEQAHYALGLLSLENDLERLELGEAG